MLVSTPSFLFAAGTVVFPFLNTPSFPDVAAQGESASGQVGRLSCLDSNPAGLAHLRQAEATALHSAQFGDVRQDELALAIPTKRGAWAMAGSLRSTDGVARTRVSSVPGQIFVDDGDLKVGEQWFQLAHGRRVHRDVAVGGALKLVRQELGDQSSVGVLADVGGVYRVDPRTRISAVLNNVGYVRPFDHAAARPPTRLRAGVYFTPNEWAAWTMDLGHRLEGGSDAHLGLEANLENIGFFRLGYHHRFDRPDLSALAGATAGVGFRWKYLGLDYAFLPFDDLGNTHRVALSWAFGPAPKRARVPVPHRADRVFLRDE